MFPDSHRHEHSTRTRGVVAVLDVVESVRLMEEDEAAFIARWQAFVRGVQGLLPAHRGRIHKSLGDGLMLLFEDAEGCLAAAVAMHAWFARGNRQLRWERKLQLRIGAHVTDYVADEFDIYGTGVNLAARITSVAGPGEIIVSEALRHEFEGMDDADLQDLGPCTLRHVARPVRLFRVERWPRAHAVRVRWAGAAANDPPAGPWPGHPRLPAGRQLLAQGDALDAELHVAPLFEVLEEPAHHLA